MKRLIHSAILALLLAAALGAASAWAADSSTFLIRNESKGTVTVSLVWSGGNVPAFKLGPGESSSGAGPSVPAAIDSLKMQVSGDCKEGVQTFNPRHVTQAVIQCRNNAFMVALGRADHPTP
jgi:hypothetical protein